MSEIQSACAFCCRFELDNRSVILNPVFVVSVRVFVNKSWAVRGYIIHQYMKAANVISRLHFQL